MITNRNVFLFRSGHCSLIDIEMLIAWSYLRCNMHALKIYNGAMFQSKYLKHPKRYENAVTVTHFVSYFKIYFERLKLVEFPADKRSIDFKLIHANFWFGNYLASYKFHINIHFKVTHYHDFSSNWWPVTIVGWGSPISFAVNGTENPEALETLIKFLFRSNS